MWNIFGRFLFFALMIMQCVLLASYPATYNDTRDWYAVTILFLPAALGFWWWMNSNQRDLGYAWLFGTMYVWLGLVPLMGIVFGRTDDKIESKGFLNPSTLRMTLCITPLLLMIVVVASSDEYDENVTECLLKAVINLYDGIELLGVILDENECSHGISRHFKNTLIAFACISYLWLPVVVAVDWPVEDRTDEPSQWVIYYLIQAVFEAIFLGLRLGLSLGYRISASIFINKNIFLFIVHIRQIFNLCCGTDDHEASREASTSAPRAPVRQNTVAPQPGESRQITEVISPVDSSFVSPSAPPPPPPPPLNPYY